MLGQRYRASEPSEWVQRPDQSDVNLDWRDEIAQPASSEFRNQAGWNLLEAFLPQMEGWAIVSTTPRHAVADAPVSWA